MDHDDPQLLGVSGFDTSNIRSNQADQADEADLVRHAQQLRITMIHNCWTPNLHSAAERRPGAAHDKPIDNAMGTGVYASTTTMGTGVYSSTTEGQLTPRPPRNQIHSRCTQALRKSVHTRPLRVLTV